MNRYAGIELRLVLLEEERIAGVHEEDAEYVEDPVETLYQPDADGDEGDAEDDGKYDAHEQGPAGVGLLHPEIGEDDDEDEDVVHAQRPFHQIGREVLGGRERRLLIPQEGAEGERQRHPEECLVHGLPDGHPAVAAVDEAEVEEQG
jgi:hypothetical protein